LGVVATANKAPWNLSFNSQAIKLDPESSIAKTEQTIQLRDGTYTFFAIVYYHIPLVTEDEKNSFGVMQTDRLEVKIGNSLGNKNPVRKDTIPLPTIGLDDLEENAFTPESIVAQLSASLNKQKKTLYDSYRNLLKTKYEVAAKNNKPQSSATTSLNPTLKTTHYTSTETTEYECADKNPECGSVGIRKQTIEKEWLGNKNDTSSDPTIQSTKKVTTTFTPRYGGRTCTVTEFFIRGPSGGTTDSTCTGDSIPLSYPTVVDTDVTKRTGGGTISETTDSITKKYSEQEKTTFLLTVGGDPQKKYGIQQQADG